MADAESAEWWFCVRPCTKCFLPHLTAQSSSALVLFRLLYRWGDAGSTWAHDLQSSLDGRGRIWPQVSLIPESCSFHWWGLQSRGGQAGSRTLPACRGMVWSITRAYSYPSSMTSIHRGLKSNGNFISCFPSAAGSYKKETVKTRISRCV